ncbi:MAG: NUDIX domain-containing protein [Planctomycetota bacterium]|nr:NUDIX domain-containing protein [Planctomycetota bacterium]
MTTATEKIARLLAAHVPADAREAESLRKIQALVATASAPFSREHFVPGHLTASGMVFNAARTKTLLIFHGKLHRWLQPGGHFEPGEDDPGVASMREVREETLLEPRHPDGGPVLLDVDVHLIPARKTDPAHEHHDLRMLLIGDEGKHAIGDGVKDAQWFTREECAAMDLDPGLVRGLKKVMK